MSAPVDNLVHRLHAKRCGKGWLAKCPAHDDRNPSLSIDEGSDGRALLKCHAGCDVDSICAALDIRTADLFPANYPQPSGNGATLNVTLLFNWRACIEAFTEKHLERLAEWRGYSVGFCSWLKENGLVGLYEGHITFPVHDRAGNVVGAHYRLQDGSWRYYPKGAKVRPLVIGELIAGEPVHIFESQWDCFAFLDVSGERSGVIVTRGASNGALVSGLIPKRATVCLWTQNDAPGARWEKDICANTKAVVKRAKIPAEFKDVNQWLQSGATERDLIAAMVNAEVVREAEQSWMDALNESVVTSNELRDLELVPRKKLLGDWFCEGDLGFIFAFRGVGKTWLALAIAQALSSGGKLGDWQAHQGVKVLYADGEMPPDLMRDRCQGLQASNANLEFLNHEILFERTGKVLNITKAEVQQAITARCVNTRSKVLVLDNLSTLASGMKENEADSWELVNNWLLDLRRRKIAVVIVHHAGRSGEMRGTSKREDNVFWIIVLDDTKKNADDRRGARFVSRFTKPSRNTQEEAPAYEWHFVTDEVTGLVSIGHKQAQTMDVFLGLIEDGVTECGQIAQEMKVSSATISRLAKRAIDAGKIVKDGREYILGNG
jgi:putative DNA primase/helicase